jgi:hypothetical protein
VLLSQRLYFIVSIAILLLLQPSFVILIMALLWPSMLFDGVRPTGGPAPWLVVAIALAWMLFAAASFHRTRNRSLVGS